MEITQLTALVGALAILASASILTIGSLTLLNVLRERLNRRERSVHEIDQDEHGNRLLRVTHPPVLVGRRADFGRLMARTLPPVFFFLYVASSAYFLIAPMLIYSYDGHVEQKSNGFFVFFDGKLPNFVLDYADQTTWGNVFLLVFCMYCVLVVFLLLVLKMIVELANQNRIGRDFLLNNNMLN